jgi:hypothetical protein
VGKSGVSKVVFKVEMIVIHPDGVFEEGTMLDSLAIAREIVQALADEAAK